MQRTKLQGWESTSRQTPDGAVESEQRVVVSAPVVEFDEPGAITLGLTYWREVERFVHGVVRRDQRGGGLALRLLGRRPVLLRFEEPQYEFREGLVSCRYAIAGGLLAQRPGGAISFTQASGDGIELRSAITHFFPALAARAGRPDWTGTLYNNLQSRAHVAISRRYFRRLVEDAAR